VRVYRRVQRAGPSGVAIQFEHVYVTEQRTLRQTATPTGDLGLPAVTAVVNFECDMFNDHDDDERTGTEAAVNPGGYCFVYVSTANSGAVNEQKSICLPMFYNQSGQCRVSLLLQSGSLMSSGRLNLRY
jgi:hypothetical protein